MGQWSQLDGCTGKQINGHGLCTGHSFYLPQDWLGSVNTHLQYIHQYCAWNTQKLAFGDYKITCNKHGKHAATVTVCVQVPTCSH